MENLTQQEIDYSLAKERVQKLKKFYTSLAIFAVILALYIFRNYYFFDEILFLKGNNFSFIFWIWGIILAVKAGKLFFLNPDWERKMLERELKQNRNGNL